jgi:hypothetical protein
VSVLLFYLFRASMSVVCWFRLVLVVVVVVVVVDDDISSFVTRG